MDERPKHPFELLAEAKKQKPKKKYSDQGLFMEACLFLHGVSFAEYCPNIRDKHHESNCSCMHIFRPEGGAKDVNAQPSKLTIATASFIVQYCRWDVAMQRSKIMEWIRYSERIVNNERNRHHCVFIVPLHNTGPEDNWYRGELPLVCRATMQVITGKWYAYWNTCKNLVRDNLSPHHGLQGKASNRANPFNKHVRDDLHAFLTSMKQFEEPVATQILRDHAGILTRNDDTNKTYLPPWMSKRNLFHRFLHERGWDAEVHSKTKYTFTERNDKEWNDSGKEVKERCCWQTFLHFWKVEFPDLEIRSAAEDICDECYMYVNKLKSGKRYVSLDDMYEDDDEDDDEDDADHADPPPAVTVDAPDHTSRYAAAEATAAGFTTEDVILEASAHIQNAIEMRRYANEKMSLALDDHNNNIAWGERHDCIVCDYCQNLQVPFLGNQQPGQTYYYSPLTVNCFGVANVGIPDHELRAYIFHEGEGKKGGDSVSSFLYLYIDELGWIDLSKGPRRELTIIMDNCSGQNKNRMVLRLCVLLAELGYYERVNCCFLVAGHTKNACDRLFNILKLKYRLHNVFTMDQLMTALKGREPIIQPYRVKPGDLKEFGEFEDIIYKRIESGTVKCNQQFYSLKSRPGVLFKSETTSLHHQIQEDDLIPDDLDEEERAFYLASFPDCLQATKPDGIRAIKQVELHTKWKPFVPEADKNDDLYKEPLKKTSAKVKATAEAVKKAKQSVATAAAATDIENQDANPSSSTGYSPPRKRRGRKPRIQTI